MAQGSRLPCTEGVRVGVIPLAFPFLSMGTGEPDTSKVVCPVRGGTGRKGSNDLARGLPYLRSRFRQRLTPGVDMIDIANGCAKRSCVKHHYFLICTQGKSEGLGAKGT